MRLFKLGRPLHMGFEPRSLARLACSTGQSTATYTNVAVVVAVGETVWTLSSKTLAYDCLCTHELCMASMIATSLLGRLGIFCQMFVKAVLERVYSDIWGFSAQ